MKIIFFRNERGSTLMKIFLTLAAIAIFYTIAFGMYKVWVLLG